MSKHYLFTGQKALRTAVQKAEKITSDTEDSSDKNRDEKVDKEQKTPHYQLKEAIACVIPDSGADNGNDSVLESDLVDAADNIDIASTVDIEAKDSLRSALVQYAIQYLGNPYVWGGTSLTRGADCSGFTLSVFQHFGISLPHSARSQSLLGSPVDAFRMQPGDLVFYGSDTIDHVAIYIGDGQIVHAANSRKGIILSRWNYMAPVKIVNILDTLKIE